MDVFAFCVLRIGSGKQNTAVIVDDGKDDDDDETFVVEDNHAITNDIDAVSPQLLQLLSPSCDEVPGID
jgi:hypothetical protein